MFDRSETKNQRFIAISLSVIILGAIGFFTYRVYKSEFAGNDSNTADNAIDNSIGEGVFGTGEAKIEQVPLSEGVPVPDLNNPVSFSGAVTLSSEAKEIIRKKIEGISSDLKANPQALDKWLELGIWRKGAGDYEGAKEAWQYAVRLSPGSSSTYSNLGNLHQYYIKDFPLSESYLKKALSLAPGNISGYRALYDLYIQSYREKLSEVPALLKSGLKENPDNYDLLIMFALYYKDAGDKTSAILYYNKAIVAADRAGQSAMKQVLSDEIKNLSQ